MKVGSVRGKDEGRHESIAVGVVTYEVEEVTSAVLVLDKQENAARG